MIYSNRGHVSRMEDHGLVWRSGLLNYLSLSGLGCSLVTVAGVYLSLLTDLEVGLLR